MALAAASCCPISRTLFVITLCLLANHAIAADNQGRVDTLYREFQITVAQMVREFGKDKCSTTVQNLFDRGALEQWVTVIHAIEPRADRDPNKRDDRNMAWKSVYVESGADETRTLRESGYRSFPALCPRWALAGGDIYGNSPAMEALGDVRQLQHRAAAQGAGYRLQE